MPVYRRRFQTSIAKVNARSIDGYLGEGTPCFFIRGTILSDSQVNGEYRTLAVNRPGNVIDIEDFDGEWATLVIVTRSGNRPGDNLTARIVVRDRDLRTVGIDCERIMAGLGTFEQPDEPEAVAVPEPPTPPTLHVVPAPPPVPASVASNGTSNGSRKPTLDFDFVPEPEPEELAFAAAAVAESEPEPVAAVAAPEEIFVPAADVLIVPPTSDEPAADTQTVIERIAASTEPTANGSLFGGRTAIADGRVLVEMGTGAIVAIGLPVVLYLIRSLFNKRK
jgi:hypothetical protein